ncbi:GTP-binding protein HflX [Limosilactobacillus coleohominis 101-4-CHN]|uniref:GTPase HflX n=1 Tax=Limosilactobacillus coleohominis 101-4-CHN TaxID=575594 RepID=C7XX39_9LACO|nr:GTPase HflX [Limosilactobacillus coleohominis]EEU29859.1 GTP-binding protein HflX [Limosilactobacillus coleohominis 101-4-CHN]
MDTTIQADEKVIVTGLNTGQEDYDYSMTELKELAQANQMDVVDRIDQVLDRPNAATYFGSGKIDEIKNIAAAEEATTVITNDELSPSQLSNLNDEVGVRVIDRTALILEIFAKRAQTKEAKIQVQIAKLEYQLPRLHTAANQRLDQQTGGGAGFANRGAGETKIEMDRRVIQKHISHLRHELKEINKSEATKRALRDKSAIPTAALVGYTNAGKSTLMNKMIERYGISREKEVFEKDMLFSTLDTSVRQLTLPDQKRFILSDTVGFVSKLPTHLIEAFKSTLTEAAKADLLIQIIDYSDPHRDEMIKTTEKTLHQIGIDNIPMIYVFNKADKTNFEYPTMEGDDHLVISAKDDKSLDLFIKTIKDHLFDDYVDAKLLIPFTDGHVVSYLNEHANITDTDYQNDGTLLQVEISPRDLQRFSQYVVE